MRTWSHSGGIPNYELPRTPPRWLRQRLPDRVSRRDGSDFVQQFDQEGGIEKTGFHLREIRSRESPVRLAARPAFISLDIHRSGVARLDKPSRSDPLVSDQGNDRQ